MGEDKYYSASLSLTLTETINQANDVVVVVAFSSRIKITESDPIVFMRNGTDVPSVNGQIDEKNTCIPRPSINLNSFAGLCVCGAIHRAVRII